MNKVINWIFGSFFRTLGRILVYILIGYLLFNLINLDNIKLPLFNLDRLFFMDVNADVIKIPSVDEEGYVLIDNNLFSEYYNLSPVTANSDTNFRISLTTLNSVANDYPFLFVDICSTAEIYAYRTSSLGQSCTNSCFSNQVSVIKTNYNCTANSYQGNIYRLKVPITKWGDGVDTDTKNINDRLSIGANINYNAANTIYGIYLSNDVNETLENINYTSSINNVNNNISSSSNDIINNQNSNSQAQINNANSNTDKTINSQKVCNVIDLSYTEYENKVLNSSGSINTNQYYNVTKYINIYNATIEKLDNFTGSANLCFYNENKTLISCQSNTNTVVGILTIPTNSYYVRFSINNSENKPKYKICKNGNQATNDTLNDMNNNLTNDNINEQGANDFVNGLNHEYSSLTPFSDFINLPLSWIQSLLASNQSCQPIELPLPFVNRNLTLPCMTDFWNSMGLLKTLIELVWIAIVGVRIFNGLFLLTCDTLDPNPDKDMTRLRTWEL